MATGERILLSGGSGCGPEVQGTALVCSDNFGVRYDLDPESGVISNRDHQLYGESVAGKVLVFANPKGGVAASWALADLVEAKKRLTAMGAYVGENNHGMSRSLYCKDPDGIEALMQQ